MRLSIYSLLKVQIFEFFKKENMWSKISFLARYLYGYGLIRECAILLSIVVSNTLVNFIESCLFLSTEKLILFIIIWDVYKFIVLCLIPWDPWFYGTSEKGNRPGAALFLNLLIQVFLHFRGFLEIKNDDLPSIQFEISMDFGTDLFP